MGTIRDLEGDIDFVVDGSVPDPLTLQESIELIASYKARPEHARQAEEAAKILAA